jgi:hypothetical protein
MVGRNVLGTPYEAARALLDWAVDLWPYVNGKSITCGVDLKSLAAPDMLDVIHFLFEEDMHSSSTSEQAEAKDKSRSMLYSNLYGKVYKYASKGGSANQLPPDIAAEMQDYDMPTPVDPFERSQGSPVVKPFVPATSVDSGSRLPFGTALEAPLGH